MRAALGLAAAALCSLLTPATSPAQIAMDLFPREDPTVPAQDSAPALQAAIDQSADGVVAVPPGVYDLEAPINLGSGTTLSGGTYVAHDLEYVFGGAGNDISLSDVEIHGTFLHGVWFAPATDCQIERCQVFGGLGQGVFLNSVTGCTVRDCTIGSGADSVYAPNENQFSTGILIGTLGGLDNRIAGNTVSNTAAGGIICNNTTSTVVEDNLIEEIAGNQINTGYGIQFYLVEPSPFENTANVARGNLIMGTDGTGIYVSASPNTIVRENTLLDVVRTQFDDGSLVVAGIAVSPKYDAFDEENPLGLEQNTVVADNDVILCGQSAISFFGQSIDVRGNYCERATNGILVRGGISCSITRNRIQSCLIGITNWSWQPYEDMIVRNNFVDGRRVR